MEDYQKESWCFDSHSIRSNDLGVGGLLFQKSVDWIVFCHIHAQGPIHQASHLMGIYYWVIDFDSVWKEPG